MSFSSYCSFNFAHYKPNSPIHRFTQGVGKIAILTPVGVLPFSASLFYPEAPGGVEEVVCVHWGVSTDREPLQVCAKSHLSVSKNRFCVCVYPHNVVMFCQKTMAHNWHLKAGGIYGLYQGTRNGFDAEIGFFTPCSYDGTTWGWQGK